MTNQVALITGASRGIGAGIAIELAKEGFDVVINFNTNLEAARKTADLCVQFGKENGKSVTAEIFKADISNEYDRRLLVDFVKNRFGRLDLLVNNAGVAPLKRVDILEADEEGLDRLFRMNLKAPFFLTQMVARWMIELVSKDKEIKPKIVFITSISAYTASVNRAEYCISKAGLSMCAKLFATRLADNGILVYEVRPGIIETDMTKPVKEKYDKMINSGLTPIKRWGTPEDVGKAVAAIAKGYLPFSVGEVINVDGGFHIRTL
ncbi:MAG: 3-ketoacyl-ACP reductase [Verrucomicrobiia bacterium]